MPLAVYHSDVFTSPDIGVSLLVGVEITRAKLAPRIRLETGLLKKNRGRAVPP